MEIEIKIRIKQSLLLLEFFCGIFIKGLQRRLLGVLGKSVIHVFVIRVFEEHVTSTFEFLYFFMIMRDHVLPSSGFGMGDLTSDLS